MIYCQQMFVLPVSQNWKYVMNWLSTAWMQMQGYGLYWALM